ncbi:MAG: D-alanyl-D-alanine carboxypeptidase [Ruminococcaceae bacterium]|nr:D-alanyl-D-alanine carboxypeptidase [Oscillospiraceae bacterium]
MSGIIKSTIKTISSALLAGVLMLSVFASNVAADDIYPDNPDDGIITQNEQQTDLLNEKHDDWPTINAAAFILYDATSGAILVGKDYETQKEPASMTKVMTILLALERLDMNTTITVNSAMAKEIENLEKDYVRLGLQEGEEITVKDLIYAAVLKSANDCCIVLAMHMAGTEADFCKVMNEKAEELGCRNTHFTSCFGYAKPDNLTTAYDLSLILNECVTNTIYSQIAKTYTYKISATNKYSSTRELTNANRFISTADFKYDYYVGGKTGFTDSAGNTLCAAAKKDGRTLIGVLFNAGSSTSRYRDMIKLFDFGYTNFTTVPITEAEFTPIINDTRNQMERLMSETNLYISEQKAALSGFVTTTSSRAQLGSTNKIDLSKTVIDSQAEEQTLEIPLCKIYSDKTYVVGKLVVKIEQKAGVIEINPKKKTHLTDVRRILIMFAALSGMILVLIVVALVVRANMIKRKRNESTRRARML